MALSRKSMVDSVYTIWKTCPSREHSSSAATCRGDKAGPSWAACRPPGSSDAQPAPGPRALAPHRLTGPQGDQPTSRRFSGPKGARCVCQLPALLFPRPGPPTPCRRCCPKAGGRHSQHGTRLHTRAVKAGSPLGWFCPRTRGSDQRGLRWQQAREAAPQARTAQLEGSQHQGGALIKGSPRQGVPPTVSKTQTTHKETKELPEAGSPQKAEGAPSPNSPLPGHSLGCRRPSPHQHWGKGEGPGREGTQTEGTRLSEQGRGQSRAWARLWERPGLGIWEGPGLGIQEEPGSGCGRGLGWGSGRSLDRSWARQVPRTQVPPSAHLALCGQDYQTAGLHRPHSAL